MFCSRCGTTFEMPCMSINGGFGNRCHEPCPNQAECLDCATQHTCHNPLRAPDASRPLTAEKLLGSLD